MEILMDQGFALDTLRSAIKLSRGISYALSLIITVMVAAFSPLWAALLVAVPVIWYLYVVTTGSSAGLSFLTAVEKDNNNA